MRTVDVEEVDEFDDIDDDEFVRGMPFRGAANILLNSSALIPLSD